MADTLTIALEGRIDSSNASQIEAMIEEKRTPAHDDLVLDLRNLEYLSSAGLRVILRLKKAEPSLTLVNASSEVYEIFEMTGFTEMMEIKKAFRHFSVEGCQIIGEGANGAVYRLDADTIIKVYKNPDSLADIQRERELARKALVMGIPTAIPYDVVEVDGKYGSVFELLNAKSFAQLVAKEPENVDKYVRLATEVLMKFHATTVKPGELPDVKEKMCRHARDIQSMLPEQTAKRLIELLDAVPASNQMLHGDYHVKNIMMQDGEVLLIDMDTLCQGNPVFEFSSIYSAYQAFSEVNPNSSEDFLGIPQSASDKFVHDTMAIYLGTDDESVIQNAIDKAAVVSYMRMARWFSRRDMPEKAQHFVGQLVKAVDKVESLAF